LTARYGLPDPIANPFAIDAPIINELAKPGPLVAAKRIDFRWGKFSLRLLRDRVVRGA